MTGPGRARSSGCPRLFAGPSTGAYRDRGILVSVDAMRSAPEVGREILVAVEAMRPFLEREPTQERLPVDLTSLGEAFGAAGPAPGTSG
jgi:hypothetical protein